MSFSKVRWSEAAPSFPNFGGSAGAVAPCALACVIAAILAMAPAACADPAYVENLTFSDRSPGSPRANPFEAVLRLDANDTSFAGAAGWGSGFTSWQQQFDHTKSLVAANQDAGLIFIGDSLTQNWGNVGGRLVNGAGAGIWNSSPVNFDQYRALNLGIAGDQTQNLIYRVDNGQLSGLNPGLVVLMIGTNNLFAPAGNPGFPAADYVGPAHTAAEVADGVLAAVQRIHAQMPQSHILTMSVLRGLNTSDPDRITADAANDLVADAFETDTNPQLHYLDVSPLFRNPNGTINANIGGDGVHLTAAGYLAWATAIAPFVAQYATPVPSAAYVNVAPLGSASWSNSVDGSFGHFAADAIDDDFATFNHSDFDGSFGGNTAQPDVFTLELDRVYDLKSVEVVNRGGSDGGSTVSDARLNGVLLEVLGASGSDVLFSATLADDPTLLGEKLTFDNQGQGFAGARYLRLTSSNFLHIGELRANVAAVPEAGAVQLLGLGSLWCWTVMRPAWLRSCNKNN